MRMVSSRSSAPEDPLQARDLPTNAQAAEVKLGETGGDPAESGTGGTSHKDSISSFPCSPPENLTPTPDLQTTEQAVETGRNTDEELDPADYMKTDDNEKRAKRNSISLPEDFKGLTEEENVEKFSADESEPAASKMAVSYQHGSEVKRIESSASSSSGKCHDLPTNEQADENESGETGNKGPDPDPAHSKTSDNGLEENGAKRKSMFSPVAEKSEHVGEASRKFTNKENEMKLTAAVQRKVSESEPAASEDDVNLPDCDKQSKNHIFLEV
uniref:CD48 molecule n=1 Tax=Nothobranchius kadleci TaxID=1051664 RepID=A0A1A8D845_NOTKA